VTINSFGEGFNVNPMLIIAKQLGNWVLGIGTGYIWRGEYDYSKDIGMKDYDPGDIFNINGDIRYYFTQNTSARLFAGYFWYDEDKVDDRKFYQEGEMYQFGLGVNHNQQKWDTGLTLRGIFRNKGKIRTETGGLSEEDKKGHGDEYTGDLYVRYLLNDRTTLKTALQGLLITDNDYSSNAYRYIGERRKLSLGLGVSRIFSQNIEGSLDLKGFIMHDDKANFPNFRSSRDYKGFSIIALLTSRF
jgi:hypothetical protein